MPDPPRRRVPAEASVPTIDAAGALNGALTGYPTNHGTANEKSDIGTAPMNGDVFPVAQIDIAMKRVR
ncbi:hypothetical protein [Burkholderia territorii]|uniref:hypothetical protein n=1 Tax=Burkholderia territorii TaxID=1503055 RepID=UPI000AACF404|nr:hypothetical protein [Burkholderia territorii]